MDIIQAVGRAIRKAEHKRHGVIILPVYIGSGEDDDTVLEDSSFKQVWRVLKALRSHDDQLASELDNLRANLGKQGKVRASLPAKITLNLPTRVTARFADAFYLRTVRSITPLPPLTEEQILKWADAHHQKTGAWPKLNSGAVLDAPGETWTAIQRALQRGGRSLPGGSSLAQLLAERRGVRNIQALPDLTVHQILKWADGHHQKTGQWPNRNADAVLGAPGEKWESIQNALVIGLRGLPGGSSLARLLTEMRRLRNIKALPDLAISQILQWADAHHQRTSQWPNVKSGGVLEAPGEKWAHIDGALARGQRGLLGGSSLARLLTEKRGHRNIKALPDLTTTQVLEWADAHHQKTGLWPNQKSGVVMGARGETWAAINGSLNKGRRGLPRGFSLPQLLAKKRGVRNIKALPDLTVRRILKWADGYHQKTGQWPNRNSGAVLDAPGEKWRNIQNALYIGMRGLPGGSSLAKLLRQERG